MKAVILAGGGGTRLWPLSTPEKPKQLQALVSDKTMLEETIERLDFLAESDIYLAINEKHTDLIKELCPQIPEQNILVEPALRDTSSCIGFAAAILEKRHPGEVMVVIYADHLITNKEEFQKKVRLAGEIAAAENTLNIVEVEAENPNTNYGYVKLGKELAPDVYALDSFTEKPDLPTAIKFVESEAYLWNTGIFVWKSNVLLSKYAELHPETYQKFMDMAEDPEKIPELYPSLEKISLDYAIMEKVDPSQIRIIKANNLGWSDIGNWEAIWKELAQSDSDNITRGSVAQLNCKGSLIYSNSGRSIKAIGLENIVVVDTPEGLLISTKKDSKRVKEI